MSEPPSHLERLRLERDRFIAFAFAAADVLIELDSKHRVCYAAGATRTLFGADATSLLGRRLFDRLENEERDRLLAALAAIPTGNRMPTISVRLRDKALPPVAVTGYYLTDFGGRFYLALCVEKPAPQAAAKRDGATGLLDTGSFGALVSDRIQSGKENGADCELTLIDLNEFNSLREHIDAEAAQSFFSQLGNTLRASSLDGDSAGRFDNETYGLLHERSLDVDGLRSQISTFAQSIDPQGVGFSVQAATVNLEEQGTNSPEHIAKAVLFTINKFSERQGDAFSVTSLSQGYELMLNDTVEQISKFKTIVEDGKFDVALQPIVDLETRQVHHYEALVRFDNQDGSASPAGLIGFAEETGIIGDLDLAMARRAIELLTNAAKTGQDLCLAVNLSGRSLSSPAFIASLLALLGRHSSIRSKLWFEITESSKIKDLVAMNNLIQSLRAAGHVVCLDDFGAGAAAFQYLRALEVDVVKIDGAYVREALTRPRGKAFLKAMVGLCRDLDIVVVAEMVEDENTVTFLRECGVQFAQGYLFGPPVLTAKPAQAREHVDIPPPVLPHLAQSRTFVG